jgi:hypothetical protein
MAGKPFDMAEVGYVERVVVGNTDPSAIKSQEEIQAQMNRVNECLTRSPKGTIIGKESGFTIYQIGETQAVLSYISYHIGFKRKPTWLHEDQ